MLGPGSVRVYTVAVQCVLVMRCGHCSLIPSVVFSHVGGTDDVEHITLEQHFA